MIILNPFAFPKPPTVKITKEVKKQLKPDNTILPSHEERDAEKMREFAKEVNLMKVGLIPRDFEKKVVEKVPFMKIEEEVKEEVQPKNKKERKQMAMKEGKDKKAKIEKLEKEIKTAKEEGKKELVKELKEAVEDEETRPAGFLKKHKIKRDVEISKDADLNEIYKVLTKVKFEGTDKTPSKLGLRPRKKKGAYVDTYDDYIKKVMEYKPINLVIKK